MTEQDLIAALATLECEQGCSREGVKASYRQLVKVWHPDRFQGDEKLRIKATEKMKAINDAYRHLEHYFEDVEKIVRLDRDGSGSKQPQNSRPNVQTEMDSRASKSNAQSQSVRRRDQPDEAGLLVKTPEQVQLEQKMAAKDLTMQIDLVTLAELAVHVKMKGVDLTFDPTWPTKGSAFIPMGLQRVTVVINPNRATLDTPGNLCIGHVYTHFLRNSPNASDRVLIARYERIIKGSGVIEKLNAEQQKANVERAKMGMKPLEMFDAEQYMASQQGFESILRHPKICSGGEYGKLFGEIKGRMNFFFDRSEEKDIRCLIDMKWHEETSFDKHFGI